MNEDFLIGTYTSKTSKGMYAVTLNHDHQQLENVRLVAASQKPAYLQQVGDRVFAIKQDGDLGGVASYQLKDGQAELIDQKLGAGRHRPTWVTTKTGSCYTAPITTRER